MKVPDTEALEIARKLEMRAPLDTAIQGLMRIAGPPTAEGTTVRKLQELAAQTLKDVETVRRGRVPRPAIDAGSAKAPYEKHDLDCIKCGLVKTDNATGICRSCRGRECAKCRRVFHSLNMKHDRCVECRTYTQKTEGLAENPCAGPGANDT